MPIPIDHISSINVPTQSANSGIQLILKSLANLITKIEPNNTYINIRSDSILLFISVESQSPTRYHWAATLAIPESDDTLLQISKIDPLADIPTVDKTTHDLSDPDSITEIIQRIQECIQDRNF